MKLKKIFLYSATMLLLVSCANEDKQGSSGYGAINVQVSADYKVVPVTCSTAESASTIENPDVSEFALKLVSSDGSFSRAWDSLADFDPATKIPVGAYTMSAFYGDIDIEGFEKPFYLGETPVAVRDRENSSVEINCTLANEKENTRILTIVVSDAIVVTEAPARSGIWAKKATLSGTLVKETSETLSFQYRKSGSQEWISVPAVLSGTSISAEVTQLEPGTTYEYQAVAGTQASVKTITFTTEEATTLPNSSFEDWHTPDKAMVIYPQGGEMFWDSGNHGSATMNKNVTTPDETYKHSGKYSVKLQSQFVGVMGIGKFAAGNLFTGQFIGRDGTNGILDFGRTFTSRPSKLRGYIKYTPGTVDYSETDALTNGATDIGSVYIALGDWDAPVRITTKDKNLFDKNDEKIIAYGEWDLTTQTQGEDGGLLEFEIPIDYRSLTRIPNYIVIVASASKYGDYFTGSTGSTMWLDDLELIYE